MLVETKESITTIKKPNLEVRNLITWLSNNTSKDKYRPDLNFIWLDNQYNWWAISNYTVVRGSMWDDKGKFVSPGLYRIYTNIKELISLDHVAETQAYPTDKILELWNGMIDLHIRTIPTYDPELMIPIIKPFGSVTIHAHSSYSATHLVLGDPRNMPFGRYGAILMPMTIKEKYHDLYKMAGFTVRYPMPDTFKYHHDESHGWLEVDQEALMALGIVEKISEYSYMNGSKIYLEEDVDMPLFLDEVRSQYNLEPQLLHDRVEVSTIRDYLNYSYKPN